MLKRILPLFLIALIWASCGSQKVAVQEPAKQNLAKAQEQNFEMKSSTLAVATSNEEETSQEAELKTSAGTATIMVVNCDEIASNEQNSEVNDHPKNNQNLSQNPSSEERGELKTLISETLAKTNSGTKEARQPKGLKNKLKQTKQLKKLKKIAKEKKEEGGIGSLIYLILVILLILLILRLLSVVAGPLFDILILVLLIFLVGRLLGVW